MYRTRKYLQRILLSISLLIAISLSLTSLTLYNHSHNTVRDIQYEAVRKVLTQVEYNIGFLGAMIDSLAFNLYFDNDFIPLMYSDNLDVYDVVNKQTKLDKWVTTNSYLHSIILYNGRADRFYAGGPIDIEYEADLTKRIRELLDRPDDIQRGRLVPLSLDSSEQGADVFSYVMFESNDYEVGDSVMLFNVKSEWMLDNIHRLNNLGAEGTGTMFVVDGDGRTYDANVRTSSISPEVRRAVEERLQLREEPTGQFTHRIDGKKQLVTYMATDRYGWTVVNLQPYDEIFGKIVRWRTTTLLLAGAFFLLSLGLSVLVSHKLYRPIDNLLNQVKGGGKAEADEGQPAAKDEMVFLADAYLRMREGRRQEREGYEADRAFAKKYGLRRLLSDSEAVSKEELETLIEQHGLRLYREDRIVCCILSVDNYVQLDRHVSAAEKRLYAFAITNIAEEIVSRRYPCECVDMRSGHYAVLVGGVPSRGEEEELVELFRDVQRTVMDYYRIGLSAAIGSAFASYEDTHRKYEEAQQLMAYRMVYGRMAVITRGMVLDRAESREFQLPPELEKRLIECVKSGQPAAFEETLQKLLQHMSKLHPDLIFHSALLLLLAMKQAVSEMNANRLTPLSIDWSKAQARLAERETLQGLAEDVTALFREIESRRDSRERTKNHILIDTIKEYIEDNYQDPNLSLQGIAAMLKMSSAHVGKMFKQSEAISVAEYITEIRLSHTIFHLETSDKSVSDVMERVGFINRSNFYKLFKNKFGVTPNEYRLKKSIL